MVSAATYGPWAVIAGGSEGVGACFARRLARAGLHLVLLARKPGPLEALAAEIRAQSAVEVRTLPMDLTQPDMLDRIRAATDGLDVGLLICNAGAAGGPKPFLEQTLDKALSIVRLNVVGQTVLVHHFGGRMVQRGRGGILLVSSMGGSAGCAQLAVYSGVKSYTQIFGEALWAELKPQSVDVLVLPLGRTSTPALARTDLVGAGQAPAADPDDMAAQGLDNLANGPVHVPPPLAESFQRLRSMPRREAAELLSRSLRVNQQR